MTNILLLLLLNLISPQDTHEEKNPGASSLDKSLPAISTRIRYTWSKQPIARLDIKEEEGIKRRDREKKGELLARIREREREEEAGFDV